MEFFGVLHYAQDDGNSKNSDNGKNNYNGENDGNGVLKESVFRRPDLPVPLPGGRCG
jgi:hypothetical protein